MQQTLEADRPDLNSGSSPQTSRVIWEPPFKLIGEVKMQSRGWWALSWAILQSTYLWWLMHTLAPLSRDDCISLCPCASRYGREAGSPTHLPILPLSEDPTLAIQPHLWLTNHLGLEMDHHLYTAVAAEILVFREYK